VHGASLPFLHYLFFISCLHHPVGNVDSARPTSILHMHSHLDSPLESGVGEPTPTLFCYIDHQCQLIICWTMKLLVKDCSGHIMDC
jgi:hypothetical protein